MRGSKDVLSSGQFRSGGDAEARVANDVRRSRACAQPPPLASGRGNYVHLSHQPLGCFAYLVMGDFLPMPWLLLFVLDERKKDCY